MSGAGVDRAGSGRTGGISDGGGPLGRTAQPTRSSAQPSSPPRLPARPPTPTGLAYHGGAASRRAGLPSASSA